MTRKNNPKSYIPRATPVKAMKFTRGSRDEVMQWVRSNDGEIFFVDDNASYPQVLTLGPSVAPWAIVSLGHYIVLTKDGTFLTMPPWVFKERYQSTTEYHETSRQAYLESFDPDRNRVAIKPVS